MVSKKNDNRSIENMKRTIKAVRYLMFV